MEIPRIGLRLLRLQAIPTPLTLRRRADAAVVAVADLVVGAASTAFGVAAGVADAAAFLLPGALGVITNTAVVCAGLVCAATATVDGSGLTTVVRSCL